MRVRFWGTRGSLAKPGPTTIRYGGNTSCVEVRTDDDTLIVLDCGTGAHALGQTLGGNGPVRGHLLISHTHWDHIQGFPFFGPLFMPGNEWDIYAPQGLGQHLEATLAGQMEYAYFPVTLAQLAAVMRYHSIAEGTFEVGGVRVVTRYLNHPVLALAYRMEVDGAVVVYATDHEPHSLHRQHDGATAPPLHEEDRRHVDFLAGADLVIHDAQYTLEEYAQKVGWGHSPIECVVDFAAAAGARRLALFHHDPLRDDDSLDRIVEDARRRAAGTGSALEVFAAAEGQVVALSGERHAARAAEGTRAPSCPELDEKSPTILIVDDDPDIVRLVTATLRSEGFRLLTASDGDRALAIARAEHPDLVLLDWNMPGPSGLDVCRVLRADADRRLRDVPVLLLTAQAGADDTATGFGAGVTDYVTKPFRPAHLRARVHAWLLRSRTDPAGQR